jgi:hypothetical protein
MRYDQLDLLSFFDFEEMPLDETKPPSSRGRGRPPLTVQNPLDDVEATLYTNSEGLPRVWIDDCLIGSIRAVGERDSRETSKKNYVSLNKVFRVLCSMRGGITPQRVAIALGVHRQYAWKIVKVIEFASWSIERALRSPTLILEYKSGLLPPRIQRESPSDSKNIPHSVLS